MTSSGTSSRCPRATDRRGGGGPAEHGVIPSDLGLYNTCAIAAIAFLQVGGSDGALYEAIPLHDVRSDVGALNRRGSDVGALNRRGSDVGALNRRGSDVGALNCVDPDVLPQHDAGSDVVPLNHRAIDKRGKELTTFERLDQGSAAGAGAAGRGDGLAAEQL
jgi:hypothetical protein